MKQYWLRSTFFNFAFYTVNILACFIFIPALLLPPRKLLDVIAIYLKTIRFIEETIMGLKLELRGLEHLPKEGSYIIAAKHQSAYETLKLHLIFDHPAIILKKELTEIPLWGKYLTASDVIAIDRSTPDAAIQSIKEGAIRVKKQGRPIFIFPQGTRVPIDVGPEKKPYKVGVARIYEATEDLSIIPMAINAGYFWPKTGWLKRPGTVIFEFLPPIEPGLKTADLLKRLENDIEGKSTELLKEAQKEEINKKRYPVLTALIFFAFALNIAYTALWFWTAGKVKERYHLALNNSSFITKSENEPTIWGFPGPIILSLKQEIFQTHIGKIQIQDLRAYSWPFPGSKITLETGPITVSLPTWRNTLNFDSFSLQAVPSPTQITINGAELKKNSFFLSAVGSIANQDTPVPDMSLQITAQNYDAFLKQLVDEKMIDQRSASFVLNGFNLFKGENNQVTMPLKIRDRTVFSGPIRLGKIPHFEDIVPTPFKPRLKPNL